MKRLSLLLLLAGPALPGALGCAFCESPAANPAGSPATPADPAPAASNIASLATAPHPLPESASVFRRIPTPHTFTFM